MKVFIFLICFVPNLFWTSSVFADDNTCFLSTSPENDVWVIVYDADADGNRNEIIWEGKIPAGQHVKIQCTDGHIRYDYKLDPAQPYDGDIPIACFGEQSFIVD